MDSSGTTQPNIPCNPSIAQACQQGAFCRDGSHLLLLLHKPKHNIETAGLEKARKNRTADVHAS
ncbi:hypothetical protein M514_00652 [Trichuris suis]|uniref:Uncharacterized protein n=1 Tax=Trichuris suis TaxID=68888 RepID=A0A085MMI0_9BILA|nr:hypothetical protein M513_00652 [Trichuris suis]KFD65262.1 hypothetical protein M514_00652 [Trichuris suis]